MKLFNHDISTNRHNGFSTGLFADAGLLTCSLLWGASFATMKILVAIYPANWLLFLRFFFGDILLFIFFHKKILKISRAEIKGGMIIGLALFSAITSQTIALNYLSGGRSAFLSATYVLFVPLILWFFKKIFPGWTVLIAACICMIGMALLTGDITEPFGIGDVLTLLCALIFAGQILAIAKYTQGSDPVIISFVQFATVAVLSFISGFIFERDFMLNIINNPYQILLKQNGFYELAFTTFFCTFICYTVQVCSQKYAQPSHAVIIMSLESVFGLLSGIIFLGERPTLQMAIGCVLIFFSVLMVEMRQFKHA